MNINNISLPYPVLGISDDVFPLLGKDCIEIRPVKTTSSYCFDITLRQENQDISMRIEDGYAEYVCEVNCPKTFFRKCFSSANPHLHIEIGKELLCKEVSFLCLVVVRRNFYGYTNRGFNPDYKDVSFNMEKGDILVVFGKATYNIDIEYDKLQTPGAFMEIRENTNEKEEYTLFNIASDKIEILLPTGLYREYAEGMGHNSGFCEIFHASFVFNALVYALHYIKDNPETLWARTLKYRVKTEKELKNYDLEDESCFIELAQALLGNPYQRLFNRLQKTTGLIEEE